MESTITLIILAVSALSLAISIYVAIKMKAVHYLLEQPVVKKMSPQLKLKPVKLDELMAERNRQSQSRDPRPQGGNPNNPRQGGRPHGERNDSDRRFENRGDRGDRRPERSGEGRPERAEGGRPERSEGDRPRGDRPDRQGGGDRFRDRDRNRGDRGDRRPRETYENREPSAAPAPQSEPVQPVVRSEAPAAAPAASYEAPLAPRRPLPSTEDVGGNNRNPISVSSTENEGPSEVFAGNDNDVQHGRRTQLKKKPRYEFDEAEVKTEG